MQVSRYVSYRDPSIAIRIVSWGYRIVTTLVMILSAWDLKVRGVLCALRIVHVVDFSMSHGRRGECSMPTAPWSLLSVTLTIVCDGVDLASPSIKRNLNICLDTIDDAVGLFQNITNATLIILENDSTMSCKKTFNFT